MSEQLTVAGLVTDIEIIGAHSPASAELVTMVGGVSLRVGADAAPQTFAAMTTLLTAAFIVGKPVSISYIREPNGQSTLSYVAIPARP